MRLRATLSTARRRLTFAIYILAGAEFRSRARRAPALREKYEFMEALFSYDGTRRRFRSMFHGSLYLIFADPAASWEEIDRRLFLKAPGSKSEIRNPKQIRNPKSECSKRLRIAAGAAPRSGGAGTAFRISCFGLGIPLSAVHTDPRAGPATSQRVYCAGSGLRCVPSRISHRPDPPMKGGGARW